MSRPNLQSIIQKRLDYVALMSQCGGGPGAAKYAQLITDCMQGILHAAKAVKALTPEACLEIKAIIEAKLPSEMVTTVMNALDSKVFYEALRVPFSSQNKTT